MHVKEVSGLSPCCSCWGVPVIHAAHAACAVMHAATHACDPTAHLGLATSCRKRELGCVRVCTGLTEGIADLCGVSEASHGSNAQQAQRPVDLGQVDLALHMLPSVHHLQQVSFTSVFRAHTQGQPCPFTI